MSIIFILSLCDYATDSLHANETTLKASSLKRPLLRSWFIFNSIFYYNDLSKKLNFIIGSYLLGFFYVFVYLFCCEAGRHIYSFPISVVFLQAVITNAITSDDGPGWHHLECHRPLSKLNFSGKTKNNAKTAKRR